MLKTFSKLCQPSGFAPRSPTGRNGRPQNRLGPFPLQSVRSDSAEARLPIWISSPNRTSLSEGAKVSYEVVANRGKESAENLKLG